MKVNNLEVENKSLKQSLQDCGEFFERIVKCQSLERARKIANEAITTTFLNDIIDDTDFDEEWLEDLDEFDEPDVLDLFG